MGAPIYWAMLAVSLTLRLAVLICGILFRLIWQVLKLAFQLLVLLLRALWFILVWIWHRLKDLYVWVAHWINRYRLRNKRESHRCLLAAEETRRSEAAKVIGPDSTSQLKLPPPPSD